MAATPVAPFGDSPPEDQAPVDSGASPFAAPAGPSSQAPPISENPFASPAAAGEYIPEFAAARGKIVPSRIDFSLLDRTWKIFTSNLGDFLLEGLICIGLIVAVYVAFVVVFVGLVGLSPRPGNVGARPANIVPVIPVLVVMYILMLVGFLWFYLGVVKFNLRIARGEPHSFSDLFSGGSHVLKGMGIALLMLIATYGLFFAGIAPGLFLNNDALFFIGYFLALVLNVPLMFIYMESLCLIVDHDMGVFQSLRLSLNLLQGNFLISFAIWLLTMILGAIVSVLTCGLGYLAFIPFFVLMFVMIYLGTSGQLPPRYAHS